MSRRIPAQREAARTFDALPPAKGSRAPFAESWWGRAWLRSLEESSLDTGRLSRGRTYARGGAVGPVTVAPGSAAAPVQGSRRAPYRSTVQVEQLTDQQWDRLLDMIAERAANIAALLDGEMPAGLADDAEAAGVPLLPGPRDLDPECSCPDWGYPCKHAAALCYQVARLLDRDPFVLLLLRGRGERELMDELGRRNTARASAEAAVSAATAGADPDGSPARTGDLAGSAFAARADLPSLPAPPPLPDRVGRGPALVDSAVPEPGVDPAALELLAADAAMRAHHLLAGALGARHADTVPPVPAHRLAGRRPLRRRSPHPGGLRPDRFELRPHPPRPRRRHPRVAARRRRIPGRTGKLLGPARLPSGARPRGAARGLGRRQTTPAPLLAQPLDRRGPRCPTAPGPRRTVVPVHQGPGHLVAGRTA
ncbi:SWIM zinc finger family protein [Streptomyces sp. NPDC059717]|uniref:SWIM zinc finger family protein n=1 Tax=Streptomyces sp. NPDC059717 TaxID=3346922 RepID=UPI0036C74509